MTREEEKQLIDKVNRMEAALLGTLENPGGALKVLHKLGEDFYSPEDPSQGVLHQLRSLNGDRLRLYGAAAAIGFCSSAIIAWIKSLFAKP